MLTYSRVFENHTSYASHLKHADPGEYLSFCEDQLHVHYDMRQQIVMKATISADRTWYDGDGDIVNNPVITSGEPAMVFMGSDFHIYTPISAGAVYVKNMLDNVVASATGLNGKKPILTPLEGKIEFQLASHGTGIMSKDCIDIYFYNITESYVLVSSLT